MPGDSFPGPVPAEALAYLRARRKLRPSFSYTDVWREEHATAFTVAKAMQLDVLADIRAAVDQALADGRTFRDFAKDLRPGLERKGWWGRKEMTDPLTGEVRRAQLGSPRRLGVIYTTNLRTARAAGSWERIQRTKAALPFLLYEPGPSREHRPEHAAWFGLLLPADHEFWQTHFAPNGWGCQCRIRQVSRTEAERLKQTGLQAQIQEIDPESGLPTGRLADRRYPVRTEAPPARARAWKNVRTGETHQVPVGIDPGWDYNPGVAGRMPVALDQLAEKLEAADERDALGQLRAAVGSPLFSEWLASPRGEFPVFRLPADAAAAINAERRVARFSAESLEKNKRHHPDLDAEDYRALPEMGGSPTVIVQDGGQSLVIVRRGGRMYWAAVKSTASGKGTYVTSFRRASSDGVRALLKRGKTVFGEFR